MRFATRRLSKKPCLTEDLAAKARQAIDKQSEASHAK